MTISRRTFLGMLGAAVAGLAVSRCASPGPSDHSARSRLRDCWLRLAELGEDAWLENLERAQAELVPAHRAALDDLVAAGELEAAVADQIQLAFSEAVFHVWRVNAPMTCYIVYPPEAVAREDILGQLQVLGDVSAALDPRTVQEVRAALAQDVALLEALADGGSGTDLLREFEAHELEVGRDAVEAARFLVGLMTAPTGP